METADIVVIGGGIMGASIAWHLARRRSGRIVLVERETVAAGASGRTGALLRRHYTNRPEATLAHRGYETFRAWPETVGGDCGFVPQGLIVTFETGPGYEANIERLDRNIAMLRDLGVEIEVITGPDLQRLQPFARVDDLTVASYEPSSGYVDAVAATRSMAQAAVSAGVDVREGTRVERVAVSGDRITGVETDRGHIATGTVVCAAGPWTPSLLGTTGVTLPISALRVQIAIVQRPLALDQDHFVYIDTAAGMFCRPWGSGRTLIGVGGGDQHDPVDPDCFDERNDPGYADRGIAAVARRIPAMAGARYVHGHAALYDMTPDAHPIIGAAGPDGLYVAAGFSGAGFKKGPAVGEALAGAILGDGPTWIDLTPFRASRFETDDWRRPWSDSEYLISSDFGHRF